MARAPASVRPEKPIGSYSLHGPDRRRQDRGGQAARQGAGDPARALRHERVHGAPHRLAPHRRAARLRGLRPGRPPHGRHLEDAGNAVLLLDEIEKAHPDVFNVLPPGDGPRQADRQQRQGDRFSPRHPAHDEQRGGARPLAAQRRVRRRARDGRRRPRVQAHVQPRVPKPPRREDRLQPLSPEVMGSHRRQVPAGARGLSSPRAT